MGLGYPASAPPKPGSYLPSGRKVVPGTYEVTIRIGTKTAQTKVNVVPDPKLPMTKAEMISKAELLDRHAENVSKATALTDKLRAAKKTLKQVTEKLSEGDKDMHKELLEEGENLDKRLKNLLAGMLPPENMQGFSRDPAILHYALAGLNRVLQETLFPATPAQEAAVKQVEKQMETPLKEAQTFFEEDWQKFKVKVDALGLSWVTTE